MSLKTKLSLKIVNMDYIIFFSVFHIKYCMIGIYKIYIF